MTEKTAFNIDEATIRKVGLQLSDSQLVPGARVFTYPGLEDVYIMEKDLYGNIMPEGSCFLAFAGNHGLMGQPLTLETLRNSDPQSLKKLIDANANG